MTFAKKSATSANTFANFMRKKMGLCSGMVKSISRKFARHLMTSATVAGFKSRALSHRARLCWKVIGPIASSCARSSPPHDSQFKPLNLFHKNIYMSALHDDQNENESPGMTRRRFITGAGASVLSFSILKPELADGAEANSKIDIGLIGCGNRGKWIAGLFQKHGGYNLVAAADYFQERVDEAGRHRKIPARQ